MIDYFSLAADHAKQYRDRVLAGGTPHHAPHVVVELPIGSATYSRATMDAFQQDHLTVTSIDTQDEIRTFQPGEWTEARQVDEHGRVEYHWTCLTRSNALAIECERRR